MKIFLKIILIFIFIIVVFISYFSLVGIKTDQFNTKIKNQLTKINKDIDIDLKLINLKLNPIEFKINVKILGSKIIYKKKKSKLKASKLKYR